jgi:hypothetical protein
MSAQDVDELGLSGAEPAELDEVFGLSSSSFISAIWSMGDVANQVMELLEAILGAEADVDDAILEAGQLEAGEDHVLVALLGLLFGESTHVTTWVEWRKAGYSKKSNSNDSHMMLELLSCPHRP